MQFCSNSRSSDNQLCEKFYFDSILRLGGSPYPRMDGNKVVNFLQEGHRMQKPEHVDNKLLVEKLSVHFEGNSVRIISSIQS